MSELSFTTKKSHTVETRKPLPTRPRKSHLSFSSPAGAHAVSFVDSGRSLSQYYDRKSGITYLEQCFEIINCIGYGCFGVVFKVNSHEDGKLYAVKKSRERFRNAMDRKRRLGEVERLEKLPKHPNCVQLYRAWEENDYLFLQLELCEVSLAKYTMSHHDIPEEMLWNILTDITQALKHLHDRNIVHLDIKLDNILMCNDGSFKLSDFGISLDCSQASRDVTDGDSKYIAPEVLSENFTRSADIFSLGISMLELSFDLNLPQHGVLWQRLRKGQIPHFCGNSISTELYELMKWMMHPDPEKRPTVDMILTHAHVKRLLLKRKISNLVNGLAASGKLIVSFLTFFGKAGYDILMAALLKLCPMNQDCPELSINAVGKGDEQEKGNQNNTVVTSTPMAERHSESNETTPVRLNETWEISECFDSSMDLGRLSSPDVSPSKEFLENVPSDSRCRCTKNVRVHPYGNLFQKQCRRCFKKRCSTVRNLINEFSQSDGIED